MNHLRVFVTSCRWLQHPSEETGGDGINIMWLYHTACPFSGTHALNCAYAVIIYLDERLRWNIFTHICQKLVKIKKNCQRLSPKNSLKMPPSALPSPSGG